MQDVLERTGTQTNGAVGVVKPQVIRQGIILYARVPSAQQPGCWYWVTKRRTGSHRFAYRCTCEGNFLGGHLCKHIAAVKLVEVS